MFILFHVIQFKQFTFGFYCRKLEFMSRVLLKKWRNCFSNGMTIEEAKKNIREAVQQHVASLIEHSQPIPLESFRF
jgi:hypothetical protein